MSNSRWFFFLVMGAIVLACILVVRYAKDMYKALPATLNSTMTIVPFEEWREFEADEAKFKVQIPALPQHATETVRDPKDQQKREYDMYVSQKNDGTIFMISLITYENDQETSNPTKLLKSIVEEMLASNPSNKLKSLKENLYHQYKAIDFSIENADVHMDGKAFVIGKTLYILSYIAKSADYNPLEYQHFIDSFKLLSRQ